MTQLRILTAASVLRGVGLDDLPITGQAAEIAGALPIGTANYSYPSTNVIFVHPTVGVDSNPGSILSPKRTLAGAKAAATTNTTIVLRGSPAGFAFDPAKGEYRENVGAHSVTGLTIQNYPGEAVWFDGSDVETNWTLEGGRWWAPITVKFSHVAGHSNPSSDPTSRWVDSQNPVAYWTDLCFINGVRQWKVQSNPAAGQFTVDYTTNRIYIGTDPAGKEVRVAKRTKMLHCSAKTTIRGIGWRRYATEMWELGTVYVATAGAGTVIENCHMVDVATQPLCVLGTGTLVDRCTIIRPGQTGVHVNKADNAVFTHLDIREHNWEKFKTQPHCGGIKVTFAGNVTIEHCVMDGASNRATSVWFDASCWGGTVVHNKLSGGFSATLIEATGRIIYAGNRAIGNSTTYEGINCTISQEIQVWNNISINANGYSLALWQDSREATYPGERFWDEGLRWHTVDNVLANNFIGGTRALYSIYLRRDSTAPSSVIFQDLASSIQGNVIAATAGQNPPLSVARLAGLEPGTGVVNYSQVNTFQTAYPHATGNSMTTIQNPTDAQLAAMPGGVPIPTAVANALGIIAGTILVGPPRPAPVTREA